MQVIRAFKEAIERPSQYTKEVLANYSIPGRPQLALIPQHSDIFRSLMSPSWLHREAIGFLTRFQVG